MKLLTAMVVLPLAASLAGMAAAEGEAEYTSPWVLGFSDFVPQSSGSDECLYDAPNHGGAAFISGDSPGGSCCVVAPVHFPDGATVTSVFFYIRDESGDDVTMSLRRKRLDDTSVSTILATATTDASSSGIRIFPDVTISNPVVDNTHYSYFVSSDTCLDQELDLRLYHALLFYSE